jgi:glutathione S-transferase
VIPPSTFTLYTTPLSANGRKVLAACRHLQLEPDVKIVDVYRGEGRTPEFLAIHPQGKIPVLVDGKLTLLESNAILQYVSEAHGGYRLWSHDPKERAAIARWLYWEASQWQPALAPILGGFVARSLGLLPDDTPVVVDWAEERFRAVAQMLDDHLRGREYLANDELSIADFSVGAMMMYVRGAWFPFGELPGIAAWYERIEQLDAWKETAAGPWRY